MNYHYLQEPVEDYLARTFWDGVPLDTLNGTTTASVSSHNESQTESCPQRPSLLTCVSSYSPVQLESTEDLRTWLQAAFPANRSAPQANEPEPMTSETCGLPPLQPSAQYDPDSHSWRTFQASFLLDTLEPFSETWPKAGMTLDGAYYPLPKWERRISEIGSGLWLTPAVGMVRGEKYTPETSFRPVTEGRQVHLSQQVRDVRMWPTPAAHDAADRTQFNPIETKNGTIRHKNNAETQSRASLSQVVKWWATPQARDYRTGSTKRWENPERSRNLNDQIGGQLNPNWVDWLMGFPIGWTDLKPLVMDKFQSAWLRHFSFSPKD